MTADPSQTAGPTGASRRRVAAVIAVVVVVVVVLIAKLASGGTSPTPSAGASGSPSATASASAAASGSPSPTASAPATSATPGPSVTASGPAATSAPTSSPSASISPTPSATTPETPKVLQTHKPVPIKTAAPFGDGVTAKIVKIVPVHSVGQGVGEVSGPAIKVTIRLENGTPRPISLKQVTVNTYYGKASVPAIVIFGDPSSKPFTGDVASKGASSGVYIFDIPDSQRSDVTISVSYAALSPIVIFKGAVA